ncbi:MAG: SAF domain-containing protein, partial [Actinomycetota bacterium]|nr:SAF domain-containing protein [Actinomycetota bacterium]
AQSQQPPLQPPDAPFAEPESPAGPPPLRATTGPSITPPPKLRRRPALIALGITLIALGGLAAGWLTTTVGNTHTVLAMRHTVDRGGVIHAGDLTVARVNGDPSLKTVPVGRRDQIIGKYAASDLAAGSLLTPGAFSDQTVPATGESLVGVNFTPAQLPARPLRPGDSVRVVSTPRTQDDPPTTEPSSITGTVVGTRVLADSGRTVVDIALPSSEAAGLAARAATGRIALILDAGP